jgi:hypothetical protein
VVLEVLEVLVNPEYLEPLERYFVLLVHLEDLKVL